ncbi:MAG: hypothetical protein AB1756_02020 [Acidobacteriota bacterium]
MSESLIEKFSRLEHRGQVPATLFLETESYSERASLFLVRDGKLIGWHSRNFPSFPHGNDIREITLTMDAEPHLFHSLQRGRITLFKVPARWKKYKLLNPDEQDMFCLSIPLKYGTRLFGAFLCFKGEEFSRSEMEKIKEASLCAAEFSVTLPPAPSRQKNEFQEEMRHNNSSEMKLPVSCSFTEDKAMSLLEPDGEEEAAVFKARMYARLLINNIKLYNEERVIMGRMKKDLKIRLKDEIEKAERLYRSRIPEEIKQKEDFFEKELIMNLAGGDRSALGNT